MKYPARLSDDLKYLSAWYGWNAEDKADVRKGFTGSEEMVNFFMALAAAHRAGYEQCAGNGFIRLEQWCAENGLGNPFIGEFDLPALDAMAV